MVTHKHWHQTEPEELIQRQLCAAKGGAHPEQLSHRTQQGCCRLPQRLAPTEGLDTAGLAAAPTKSNVVQYQGACCDQSESGTIQGELWVPAEG